MCAYVNHDRLELIDRPDVVDRAEKACRKLHRAIDAVSSEVALDKAERIGQENAQVELFVANVRSIGAKALDDDRPANAWLDDWANLAAARSSYAARLRTTPDVGPPPVPKVEGVPITRRMQDVGINCTIPQGILDDSAGNSAFTRPPQIWGFGARAAIAARRRQVPRSHVGALRRAVSR